MRHAQDQAHSQFNIPHLKQFLNLFPMGWFFILLVSYWSALTFSITNTESGKSASISQKVATRSPMRVHDVASKSDIYYSHGEGA
jgi:hypothetical protein